MAVPDNEALFEQMQFDYDVASTAVEAALASLGKAVDFAKDLKTVSEDFVRDGITDLNAARELVPDAIEKLGVARGSAKIAAYDAASVKAHKDEIVAAINQIASFEKKLLKLDSAAEKLIEVRFAAVDKLDLNSAQFGTCLKQITKLAAELAPDQVSVREALDAIHAKALKCVELRNAGGLQLALGDADSLPLKRFDEGLAKIEQLAKKMEEAGSKASLELRTETAREHSQAFKRRDTLAKDLEYFKARKQAIKALKVAPLDIAKALKTLGLPAEHKAALAKALAGDDARCIKALDELGKQSKLKQSGKEMLAALRKARIA